ncbi:hypothetical protein [Faecalibacillus intestinalis]|uniref:hypothetical protein n=1 Tax=Faecalibacillus intestinalis TaxID=1982626 RepID=UPI003520C572
MSSTSIQEQGNGNGPLKFSDYLEIPRRIKDLTLMIGKSMLVDVKDIDTSKIRDEQTRYFIEAIQAHV